MLVFVFVFLCVSVFVFAFFSLVFVNTGGVCIGDWMFDKGTRKSLSPLPKTSIGAALKEVEGCARPL